MSRVEAIRRASLLGITSRPLLKRAFRLIELPLPGRYWVRSWSKAQRSRLDRRRARQRWQTFHPEQGAASRCCASLVYSCNLNVRRSITSWPMAPLTLLLVKQRERRRARTTVRLSGRRGLIELQPAFCGRPRQGERIKFRGPSERTISDSHRNSHTAGGRSGRRCYSRFLLPQRRCCTRVALDRRTVPHRKASP